MAKSLWLKSLVEFGYFPAELPPPFHTSELARFRKSVLDIWSTFPNEYPRSTHETFSVPRTSKIRRNLALVNPVAQLHLSKIIADYWVEIRKHLKGESYALEVPDISTEGSRAVSPPDFPLVAMRRADISSQFDHALVSDISRFYGTLYTHAIPWALHDKAWCKSNLNTSAYKNSLGAKLDRAIRKGQDNQTLGIPVGPDTSRIISEIIGVSIDQIVQKRIALSRDNAFRLVDDWFIGFDNAGEAEDAIATLAIGCREYELELNSEKTHTIHAAPSVENLWPTELREYRFKSGINGQANSLEHYFTKAFLYSKEFPNQSVLDYAIKRSRTVKVLEDNWPRYEMYLLKAARTNPTVIPSVVQVLASYNRDGYPIGTGRILKLVQDLINKNAPLAHHAEVAWALFLAKALNITISKSAVNLVSEFESAVCALLALDLEEHGLIQGKLDKSLWTRSMTGGGLRSSMWLLAYEADLKGWITTKTTGFVEADDYFAVLKKKKISFYDTSKNVRHIIGLRRKTPIANYSHFSISTAEGEEDSFDLETSLSG
jgi:hypothetical protein